MGILKSILTWGETEKEKKRRLAKEARDYERQQESDARHQKEMDKIRGQMHNTDQYTKY